MRRVVAAGALGLAACLGSQRPPTQTVVDIVGTDYAFHTPAELPGGRTTFRFGNHGKVEHELNISRLKRGVSIAKLLDRIGAGKTVTDLSDGPVGVLFAAPGDTSRAGLTSDLAAGQTYAVICIFTDSAGAKPHHDLGMYKVITMNETKPARAAAALASDTIIATDYAFQYPRMVALRHAYLRDAQRWQAEAPGQHRSDETGSDSREDHGSRKAGGDVNASIEGDLGLLHAPRDKLPSAA